MRDDLAYVMGQPPAFLPRSNDMPANPPVGAVSSPRDLRNRPTLFPTFTEVLR
ncbi:hypothetical protein ACWDBO_18695 [Streptomyces mirabilis]|uniref:hypothetical protein n=1 Tax=Streptomyces TaxID=1883 RepID=UPI0039F64201